MKFRNGFVSNSSSTSFVIQLGPNDWDKKDPSRAIPTLTEEEIKLLEKIGFQPIAIGDPHYLQMTCMTGIIPDSEIKKGSLYMGAAMLCNQDFLLELLVAKNIPFSASVHYGHYTMVYRRDSAFVWKFHNYGVQLWRHPEKTDDRNWVDVMVQKEMILKISKEVFLRAYDERECMDYLCHE